MGSYPYEGHVIYNSTNNPDYTITYNTSTSSLNVSNVHHHTPTVTTEKPMETETEEEVEEEVYSCYNCGTEYSDEDDSNECCYDCGECGESWGDEDDALQCCNYPCDECGETWSSEDSADECCNSGGEETASMGTSCEAPWVSRGINFSSVENSDNMQQALDHWGIGSRPNPTAGAADFYLLDIISNDLYRATGERTKSITPEVVFNMKNMLGMEIEEMREHAKGRNLSPFEALMLETSMVVVEQTELFDRVLLAYCQMAIGGELRHHQAIGGVVIDPPSRRSASWFAWKDAVDMVGPDIFLDAALLFREYSGSSYGGKKWAVPCEIVHMRLTNTLGPTDFMNRKLFIDRVWTLEHNGGCFLNKVDWPKGIDMRPVLDAHASNPENTMFLWTKATKPVKKLFTQYIKMVKENNPDAKISDFDPEFLESEILYCQECFANRELGHHFGCNVITQGHVSYTTKVSGYEIATGGGNLAAKVMDTNVFYNIDGEQMNPDAIIKTNMNLSFYTAYDSACTSAHAISTSDKKEMVKEYAKRSLHENISKYNKKTMVNANRIEIECFANTNDKGSLLMYESIKLEDGQASTLKTFGDVMTLMKKKVV